MKIPLWCLLVLLACLFSPGSSDCQGECVSCGLLLQQQQLQQAFNTMLCLLECEGHISSALTWEVCKRAVKLSHYPTRPDGGALLKRAGEELELTSLDVDSDVELLREGPGGDEAPFGQRSVQYDSGEAGQPREERNAAGGGDSSEGVALSKRFGGFQRGRHGYRKLIGSPVRPLQKRYGGFIGVRKSARKWNSQKRVNQLLRQYLGMRSSRSGRFNSGAMTRVWRQNKL
uniref:Prepronociceptin b n=1 Tax=Salarias fasciatus TaxID=181472 RepID=A0A672HIR8_SALFA